jgi:hypothetical protein
LEFHLEHGDYPDTLLTTSAANSQPPIHVAIALAEAKAEAISKGGVKTLYAATLTTPYKTISPAI